MYSNPDDTVFALRAQAHASLLRTVRGDSLPLRKRFSMDQYAVAFMLPLLVTVNVVLYSKILEEKPVMHSAAPEVREQNTLPSIDETIDEQKQVMDNACSLLCWSTAANENHEQRDLRASYCRDACGIELAPTVTESLPHELDLEMHEYRDSAEEAVSDSAVRDDTEEMEIQVSDAKPDTHVGVYLTPNSMSTDAIREAALHTLQSVNSNAIVFDVKGSKVYFDSSSAIAQEIASVQPLYDLPKIVSELHEKGFYVIVRYIAVKDPLLSHAKPETQILNVYTGKGIGDVWVTPDQDDVLSYNRSIVADVIDAGVDEINLDYIRYPTEYDQTAIRLSGPEKAEKLLAFLQMVRNEIDTRNPSVKLGVSTFAILGWNFPLNFEPLGQDIPRFAEYADVISPMAYPSTFAPNAYYNPVRNPGSRNYYLVYRTLTGYKDLLGENAWKLRPWIQGYYMTTKGVGDEIQAVYDAGLCGFTVWSAQNIYDATYAAMKERTVPDHCS